MPDDAAIAVRLLIALLLDNGHTHDEIRAIIETDDGDA